MSKLSDLNEQEKIFLAGAIKALIVTEGRVEVSELEDLDNIVRELNFDDFDEHLASFEQNVKSDEDFEFLARNIFHQPTKDLIVQVLLDLANLKGFARPEEEKIIRQIREWWKE